MKNITLNGGDDNGRYDKKKYAPSSAIKFFSTPRFFFFPLSRLQHPSGRRGPVTFVRFRNTAKYGLTNAEMREECGAKKEFEFFWFRTQRGFNKLCGVFFFFLRLHTKLLSESVVSVCVLRLVNTISSVHFSIFVKTPLKKKKKISKITRKISAKTRFRFKCFSLFLVTKCS